MKFVKRLTQPSNTNKYYIQTRYGGYSHCIDGKPQLFAGSVLANCVGYSFGRYNECQNTEGKNIRIGCYGSNNFPASALNWYQAPDGLPRGQTAKVGAVAVWRVNSGKFGHVANVEEVRPDGSWVSSESGYEAFYFKSKVYPKSNYRAGYTFLGFIYPIVEFEPDEPTPPTPVDKTLDELAKEVIRGEWGNGTDRYNRITEAYKAGKIKYDYDAIQNRVNEMLHPHTDTLNVGDTVVIKATGAATSYGGARAYGIGWTRRILKIWNDRPYPYQVGNDSGTTGFYKKEALQKC